MQRWVLIPAVLAGAVAVLVAQALVQVSRDNAVAGQAFIPPTVAFSVGVRLNDWLTNAARATTPPVPAAMSAATGHWHARVAALLVSTGIADALWDVQHTGGDTCARVAERLKLHSEYTCRLMRAAHYAPTQWLTYDGDTSRYGLTAVGEVLCRAHPESLQAMVAMINRPHNVNAFMALDTSLRTGAGGFEAYNNGPDIWQYFAEPAHAAESAEFDAAMQQISRAVLPAMLVDAPGLSECTHLCDVGGGVGTLLGHAVQRFAGLNGTVFDLPATQPRAAAYAQSLGADVAARMSFVGASFFESSQLTELKRCDCVALKYIFHDWADADCQRILRAMRPHLTRPEGVRVYAFDNVIGSRGGPESGLERSKVALDINMMAHCAAGAKERTASEFQHLFESSGYAFQGIALLRAVNDVAIATPKPSV